MLFIWLPAPVSLLNFQEAEIAHLEAEIEMLQDPQKLIANGIISPELEKLQTENAKLKFQITHLQRVCWQLQAYHPLFCLKA